MRRRNNFWPQDNLLFQTFYQGSELSLYFRFNPSNINTLFSIIFLLLTIKHNRSINLHCNLFILLLPHFCDRQRSEVRFKECFPAEPMSVLAITVLFSKKFFKEIILEPSSGSPSRCFLHCLWNVPLSIKKEKSELH